MSAAAARTMPGTTHRNGMPPPGGYSYRGDNTESPQVIAARNRQQLRAARTRDGRCPGCGYKPGTVGHQVTCGGAP